MLVCVEPSADGEDNINGDETTASTDNIIVSGLSGSIIIHKSLLTRTPTAESGDGSGLVTYTLDREVQHVSNIFDGRYFQTRQNPLYSSDSEQLDDDEDNDDPSW